MIRYTIERMSTGQWAIMNGYIFMETEDTWEQAFRRACRLNGIDWE